MTEPGLLGNVVIYDDRGRLIKTLLKNELLGMQNSFHGMGLKVMEQKHLLEHT